MKCPVLAHLFSYGYTSLFCHCSLLKNCFLKLRFLKLTRVLVVARILEIINEEIGESFLYQKKCLKST